MFRNRQSGFTVVEALLILVLVAIVGFAGYKVMDARSTKTTSTDTTQAETPQASAISSKQDLSQAVDELKKLDNSTKQDEASLRQLVQ